MTKETKEDKNTTSKTEKNGETVVKSDKQKQITKNKGDGSKKESSDKKQSNGAGGNSESVNTKYNKLKKKYRHLRDEYSKILESWEMATKQMKILLEERKFYKKKLESFLKSQNFIDEQIFKSNDPSKPGSSSVFDTKIDTKAIAQAVSSKLPNGISGMSNQQQQNKPITMSNNSTSINSSASSQMIKKPTGAPGGGMPQTSSYSTSSLQSTQQRPYNTNQSGMYQHGQGMGSSIYQNQSSYSTNASAAGMMNRSGPGQINANGIGGSSSIPGSSPYNPQNLGGSTYQYQQNAGGLHNGQVISSSSVNSNSVISNSLQQPY